MQRSITDYLTRWRDIPSRRPLVIKGARQIGKSFIVREFGKSTFENIVEVNLEERRDLKPVFSGNDPKSILSILSLQYNQAITPGRTLLFIDEIQESTEAFLALRYFFEKLPELHVITAGSLLDLALDKEKDLRVPVGRIEFCQMYPLSFLEFLAALGEKIALEFVQNMTLREDVPTATHLRLLKLFNQYLLCGGMPAAVAAYVHSQTDLRYRKLQADIIQTYRADFRKYRTRIDYEKLESAFTVLPRFACQDFKLNDLCPDYSQATTKNILRLFEGARVIMPITATHAHGLPLSAEVNSRGLKYAFLDTGLLNSFLGPAARDLQRWDHDLVNAGAIAEQAVAQELLAYSDCQFESQLYYWKRNAKGSTAQIDFVTAVDQTIVPIEVKAGTTGRLISLRLFMQEKQSLLGVRISQHPLSLTDRILSIPIYAISRINSLVAEATQQPGP